MEWRPSGWGLRVTRSPDWQLRLDGEHVELLIEGRQYRQHVADDERVQVIPGLFWAKVALQTQDDGVLTMDGLPNGQASRLAAALQHVRFASTTRGRRALFNTILEQIQSWLAEADALTDRGSTARRWITHEQQQALLAGRPALPLQPDELERLFLDENVHEDLHSPVHRAALDALHDWQLDWPAVWADANAAMATRELELARDFLDRVESKPLTEEQARAVICFDNRVQVVASAGSGKTSTMVAKAAYAIDRGFVEPERIVMLAFNKDAAKELEERAQRCFDRLGMGNTVVEARTFHALGLAIIAKATGRKPDIPDWTIDATLGFNKLAELVDDLKDRSTHFRTQWDMFRLVFGRDLPPFGEQMEADGYDRDGSPYIRTLQGERVKSLEECVIADWLFYNGVTYDYERRYEFDTATDTHRQYRPDFYYPDAGLYHEHFALDADGQPPKHFANYSEGMHWKRQQHVARGTALVETTSFGLRSGHALLDLAEKLGEFDIELDPNPDRELPDQGAKPMPDADLIGLMRTFIAHAKSNCLTLDDMAARLRQMPEDQFKERHRRFLEIAGPVFQAWDNALADERSIDFEDMLNMAAGLLEQGHYESPYELVMADEFQDASRARARLCRALVSQPGRHLFTVGDDWQSINRFAGADVSVMTGFREGMGHGQVLKLEQTFRCPQALCDASSHFVSRNPAQGTGRKIAEFSKANVTVVVCGKIERVRDATELCKGRALAEDHSRQLFTLRSEEQARRDLGSAGQDMHILRDRHPLAPHLYLFRIEPIEVRHQGYTAPNHRTGRMEIRNGDGEGLPNDVIHAHIRFVQLVLQGLCITLGSPSQHSFSPVQRWLGLLRMGVIVRHYGVSRDGLNPCVVSRPIPHIEIW